MAFSCLRPATPVLRSIRSARAHPTGMHGSFGFSPRAAARRLRFAQRPRQLLQSDDFQNEVRFLGTEASPVFRPQARGQRLRRTLLPRHERAASSNSFGSAVSTISMDFARPCTSSAPLQSSLDSQTAQRPGAGQTRLTRRPSDPSCRHSSDTGLQLRTRVSGSRKESWT
jgi:hypothetical protein